MAYSMHAREIEESMITSLCSHIGELRKEQKTCLVNLSCRKDVFAILMTGSSKSLIFQLYPCLERLTLSLEKQTVVYKSLHKIIIIIKSKDKNTYPSLQVSVRNFKKVKSKN